ncbi:MAG: Ankyrin repeat [Candidatus Midichloria mitochondrii]|nr:ankyrin repeat domain-containing protein [Candidatus Midichloria mitochondrii]MDJ1312527.1 ankyrin repeat domain-containing protein [Candidatus Midichloria mitochondrii]MDJ1583137.1 ankyrin repeat domain-containing protein [Candidatus Midichloria mitochondrii]
MHLLAARGHLAIFQETKQKLDKGPIFMQDKYNGTAMHYAAPHGNVKIMKYLKDKAGFPLSLKDKWGPTALHVAALNNKVEALKYLIKQGADYNADSFIGFNIYRLAEQIGAENITDYLETKKDIKQSISVSTLQYITAKLYGSMYSSLCTPSKEENELISAVSSDLLDQHLTL